MKLTDKEFLKLPFRVDEDVDYLTTYPPLKQHLPFVTETGIDFNTLFRYVVIFYSPKTPVLEVSNVNERRGTAATLAGLDTKSQDVKDALFGKNQSVNAIILEYLRMQKSDDFAALCVYRDAYYSQLSKLQNGDVETGEKTKDLLKNLTDIKDRIDILTQELLNKDNSPYLIDAVFQATEDERLGLTPEDIALAMADGEDPLRGYFPY